MIAPENVLLCESCGYDLTGLVDGSASACPECGALVARSMAERRRGSAWQRSPGPRNAFASWAALLRHPLGFWREVRMELTSGRSLARLGAALAAVTAAGPAVVATALTAPVEVPILLCFSAAAICGVILVLMQIETLGIRFFGARRGWRTTRAVAATVVGHGSVGWVVGGVLAGVGSALFITFWDPKGGGDWRQRVAATGLLCAFASPVVGLLLFETLVWLGWRRLKWANHPRTDEPVTPEEGARS